MLAFCVLQSRLLFIQEWINKRPMHTYELWSSDDSSFETCKNLCLRVFVLPTATGKLIISYLENVMVNTMTFCGEYIVK